MILLGHLWQIGVWAYLIVIGYGLWVDRDRGGAE